MTAYWPFEVALTLVMLGRSGREAEIFRFLLGDSTSATPLIGYMIIGNPFLGIGKDMNFECTPNESWMKVRRTGVETSSSGGHDETIAPVLRCTEYNFEPLAAKRK
jgi:hypothetical protein